MKKPKSIAIEIVENRCPCVPLGKKCINEDYRDKLMSCGVHMFYYYWTEFLSHIPIVKLFCDTPYRCPDLDFYSRYYPEKIAKKITNNEITASGFCSYATGNYIKENDPLVLAIHARGNIRNEDRTV